MNKHIGKLSVKYLVEPLLLHIVRNQLMNLGIGLG
uniref:Uncharacterized protein n=1 Tax=Anguilla anguilla TaxID=7936 RepID=A0A0E9WT60_ANGAN